MSRYGYFEVFERVPLEFEITRVDCTFNLIYKSAFDIKIRLSSFQGEDGTNGNVSFVILFEKKKKKKKIVASRENSRRSICKKNKQILRLCISEVSPEPLLFATKVEDLGGNITKELDMWPR